VHNDLLNIDTVVPYLADRGLIDASGARASVLEGGVSNVVLAVDDDGRHVVVKQSLPTLRVADEWNAPRERMITEDAALALAGRLAPGSVPTVLDRDPAHFTIVMERAPQSWTDWKKELLAGNVEARFARWLGRTLGSWHTQTHYAPLHPRFEDPAAFDALRVDPYYRTVAERSPEHAGAVLAHAAEMAERRTCFVHGDFSPKNVLVGRGDADPWVIDFEAAHRGDPVFDIAFMLTHLSMKAIHLPEIAIKLDECALAFAIAYDDEASHGVAPRWRYVFGHVGCLLLARVVGKSPAEYLTEDDRERVWALGVDLLQSPPDSPEELSERRKAASA
jgi:aminoglycoside phosphotransferase (APT) family kinase protein